MKPSHLYLRLLLLLPGCALLVGCGLGKPGADQKLQATPALSSVHVREANYRIGCLDVLEVIVARQPGWCGQVNVNAEGRILLGPAPGIRVEDCSVNQVVALVAGAAQVPEEDVRVRVSQFNSQQIYLHGEVEGKPRAIPFQGPETVLEVLKRVGITPGAAAGDIQLVRSNIASGGQPEVFPIDLSVLMRGNDPSATLRVEPFDQIYIGQTPRCRIEQCMPPVVRPLFESLFGMHRPRRSKP